MNGRIPPELTLPLHRHIPTFFVTLNGTIPFFLDCYILVTILIKVLIHADDVNTVQKCIVAGV
jgi:hypothetical protein